MRRAAILTHTALCIALLSGAPSKAQVTKKDCYLTRVKVEVLPDGTYTWNGTPVPNAEVLDARFGDLARTSPCPAAELVPRKSTPYKQVMHVVVLMQKHGIFTGMVGNMWPY